MPEATRYSSGGNSPTSWPVVRSRQIQSAPRSLRSSRVKRQGTAPKLRKSHALALIRRNADAWDVRRRPELCAVGEGADLGDDRFLGDDFDLATAVVGAKQTGGDGPKNEPVARMGVGLAQVRDINVACQANEPFSDSADGDCSGPSSRNQRQSSPEYQLSKAT